MQLIDTQPAPARGLHALPSATLRTLAGVLPAIYAETDSDRLPSVLLDVVENLIPAEAHGVVVHDHAAGRRAWTLRPADARHAALVPGFFAHFAEFAPANHRRVTGATEALALSDFMDARAQSRLAIDGEYYRPLRLADDLSISARHGAYALCVSVMRGRRGFGARDRAILNALRPHLLQAWINSRRLADLRERTGTAPIPAREWVPDPLETSFGLTPREAEVLLWVAQGKTNPEVATILQIRPLTVRTHLERVFAKLGVENRHAAGLRAIQVLGLPA